MGYLGDSYDKALLHFGGADASTTFTDESGKVWTNRGNAQIDTAQSVFGGSSGLFDGTTDWIDTPDHADFNVGAGNWTVDFRLRLSAVAALQYLFGQSDAASTVATRSVEMYFNNADATLHFWLGNGAAVCDVASVGTLVVNTWYHIALVRNGNTATQYINGTADGNFDVTGVTLQDSGNLFSIARLGELANFHTFGWIDEFRWSKGIARWAANFTPPTAPYGFVPKAGMI